MNVGKNLVLEELLSLTGLNILIFNKRLATPGYVIMSQTLTRRILSYLDRQLLIGIDWYQL